MGLDDRLFGLTRNAVQRLRHRVDPAQLARTTRLDDVGDRLRVLAAALAGAALDIRTAEHAGGARRDALFLPAAMHAADTPRANREIYVYRVAYALASLDLGYGLDAELAPDAAVLASLLAVPRTHASLVAALPGAGPLHDRLAAAVRPLRPDLRRLDPRTRALEALHLVRLGADPDDVGRALATDARRWLLETLRAPAPTPARLGEATTERIAILRRIARRRGKPQLVDLPLWGRLMAGAAAGTPLPDGDLEGDLAGGELPSGTERPSRPRETAERIELPQTREDSPLVHVLEKLFTPEEYQGGNKNQDGSDELDDHADALDELDLRKVTRSREVTRSLYRADLSLDGTTADLEHGGAATGKVFVYDEWDERRRAYRPAWCTLNEEPPATLPAAEQTLRWVRGLRERHRGVIDELRAGFERIERARRWHNRQRDGADIDLDAVVDRYATLRGGHEPDNRLFIARRRHTQDLATVILLDASLSTDAWVADRRVMDVARESVFVLGEVLGAIDVQMAIGGFFSNTRRSCHYRTVKGFGDRWERCHDRLLALRPTGYTRIGPALRHALHLLAGVKARKKLLLLISDGKPTDFDRYEGRHGVADVRQALREAAQAHVHTFALAIEATAKFYLPQMFGVGGYEILPSPAHLPHRLARVYQRLLT